jgi:hypothetical protein
MGGGSDRVVGQKRFAYIGWLKDNQKNLFDGDPKWKSQKISRRNTLANAKIVCTTKQNPEHMAIAVGILHESLL